jgi:hypothetical protein
MDQESIIGPLIIIKPKHLYEISSGWSANIAYLVPFSG